MTCTTCQEHVDDPLRRDMGCGWLVPVEGRKPSAAAQGIRHGQ